MLPLKEHIVQSLCLFYHTEQIKKYVYASSMNFIEKEFKVAASKKIAGLVILPRIKYITPCLFLLMANRITTQYFRAI